MKDIPLAVLPPARSVVTDGFKRKALVQNQRKNWLAGGVSVNKVLVFEDAKIHGYGLRSHAPFVTVGITSM